MSCEKRNVSVLKESGQRLTPQRLLILSALRHAAGHVTAAEILRRVKESYPYIDISTVYRTLNVLMQMRMISGTDLGAAEYRYEWIDHVRHHHLICRNCDRAILLEDKYLENLGTEIMGDYSFRSDIDHMAIFGLCHECREK